MIIDKTENCKLYAPLSEKLAKAFEIISDPAIGTKEDGKYEIDGSDLFYIVMHYETKPLAKGVIEAHKKYVDVQFVADGAEVMGYTPLDGLQIEQPYDAEGDAVLYKAPADMTALKVNKGMFCIFWPEDGHMPGCHETTAAKVCKVIVKIRID